MTPQRSRKIIRRKLQIISNFKKKKKRKKTIEKSKIIKYTKFVFATQRYTSVFCKKNS